MARGGDRVVAGDHPDVDAGPQRDWHGVLGLGAQRVDDADHADEAQVAGRATSDPRSSPLSVRPGRSSGRRTRAPAGPSRPIRSLAASSSPRASSIGTCVAAQRAAGTAAPGQHHVRCALDQLDHAACRPSTGDPVEGGHELVLGVERHLGEPRVRPPGLLGVDARAWRRAPPARPRSGRRPPRRRRRHGGVAVQAQAQGQPGEVGHRRAGDRADPRRTCA